ERVTRDCTDPEGADWIAVDQLSASGIGEFSGRMISTAGLWGGTGHLSTPDGWRLENQIGDGAVVSSLLIDPMGSEITPVPLRSTTEYRAVSFNPSGRFLILASSGEVQVLQRA